MAVMNTASGIVYVRSVSGTLQLGTTVQFGGSDLNFPALKRSGAGLEVKLADDSNYANLRLASLGVGRAAGTIGNLLAAGQVNAEGLVLSCSATATPAGGAGSFGILLGLASIGYYAGTGAPTLSAAKGSIYVRTDATTTTTRLYINTDGGTTWTTFTSAA